MPRKPDRRIEPVDHQRLSFRSWNRAVALVLVCFAGVSTDLPAQGTKPAPAPAAAPAPSPAAASRFLFVVDTSAAMKREVTDMVNVIVDILRSGASGQLHPGNTIGVWTFNADVYTGNLPLQTWAREDGEEIALRTAEFLRQQHFEKGSRFDLAMSGVCEIVKHSDILTTFIISDGEGQMVGTPFDREINALYRQNLADMKKNRRPIVTVLQSKAGGFTKFTVNALPWPVVIPEVPIPIKGMEPAVVQNPPPAAVPKATAAPAPTGTNRPTPTPIAAVPPPAANPMPKPAPAAAVVPQPAPATPSLVATPKAQPATPSPAAPASPTPTIVRPIPTPETMPRPAAAAPKPAQPTVVAAVTPTPAPNPTPVAQTQATAPSTLPVQKTPPALAAHATNQTAASLAVAAVPAAAGRPKSLLLAGLGLLAVGFGLILVLIMRSRRASNTSLITDVMGGLKK